MQLLLLAVLILLAIPSATSSQQQCSTLTFSGNGRHFAACNDLPHLSSSLHWTYHPSDSTISVAFVAPPAAPGGWVSWGLNPTSTGMAGTQAIVALPQPDGSVAVETFNISSYTLGGPSAISYDLSGVEAEYSGGDMRIFATLRLPTGVKQVNQVWQVGSLVANGLPGVHAFGPDNLLAKGILDVIHGSISGSSSGDSRLRWKIIHGVVNAVSWGILLPMGAMVARYLKAFKSAGPAWFYIHVSCQLAGYIVGVFGWASGLVLGNISKGVTYTTHRNIGIILFSLATLQSLALWARPKKDGKYRRYWKMYHFAVGYVVIVLGVINVFQGLAILSPGRKWINAYTGVIASLALLAVALEIVSWMRQGLAENKKRFHEDANGESKSSDDDDDDDGQAPV